MPSSRSDIDQHVTPVGGLQWRSPQRARANLAVAVRSFVLQCTVVALFTTVMLLTPVILLAPRRLVQAGFRLTIKIFLGAFAWICGLRYEVRGRHHLPATPVLLASKHLSKWDSAILPVLLGDPAVIIRERMLYSPIHGAVVRRMRHIIVPAKTNPAAVIKLAGEAKMRLDEGRSVLIFPEGTRTSVLPFPAPNYKRGVVALYKALNVPCVPIAINSGLFWPPKSFFRFPGKVIVEILPPIRPGLSAADFLARLTCDLESNSQRLVDEALRTAQRNAQPIYQLAKPGWSSSR